jgi:hypothetical protein
MEVGELVDGSVLKIFYPMVEFRVVAGGVGHLFFRVCQIPIAGKATRNIFSGLVVKAHILPGLRVVELVHKAVRSLEADGGVGPFDLQAVASWRRCRW